ncbi:TraV family lipoprotein [Candidatus Manganitrophus noduliformans]|uniref:TraV family lipoprotein n=1 Tax=Candidatus Manganitrophus noduliformans TaxID=2606439 RepID=A0A7X6DN37_9BACT|nr:TraV family lipoprotein [Candidatus Manganitrophus noduliformans]NKE70162.1 TraV family lipoprotein [Candidatus Manganitrophus noduliformans]
MRKISVGLLTVFLSGCAIFNPYNDNFTCPKTYNGKCVSPASAYQESLEGKEKEEEGPLKRGSEKELSLSEASYQSALYEKLTGLLREPTTPMIAPPQVMRVLILPYKGEGARLYMSRYVYILIEEPKWVLGNQWLNEEAAARATALPLQK